MNSETQILNWLKAGISQSPNSLNESFYFDKSTNEFFSVLVTDYFMLDENLNVAKNTTTSYSDKNQNELVNKIKRIEDQDSELVAIPRLSFDERKDLLGQFIESIESQDEKYRLKTTYLHGERTIFDLKFEIEGDRYIIDLWEGFKNEIILSKAESFLNLNNIDIKQATVWIPEEKGTITIDLTKDEEGNTIEKKSKWWQFWK